MSLLLAPLIVGIVLVILEYMWVKPEFEPPAPNQAPPTDAASAPSSTQNQAARVKRCRGSGAKTLPSAGLAVNPCMSASGGLLIYMVEVKALDQPVEATITYWVSEYAGKLDRPATDNGTCRVDLQPGEDFTCGPLVTDPPTGKAYYVNGDPGTSRNGVRSDAWMWLGDEFGEQVITP
ncbi:hypothetical protein [Saccharopolyspora shandongensis]|uniref:hypothetical protein n=1 Tax=Saccharopolyspora shandongensis TaxID=418495 RepID=UPI0033D9A4F0